MTTAYLSTPLGPAAITGDDSGIYSVSCQNVAEAALSSNPAILPHPVRLCMQQLTDYFNGQRQVFEVPLKPQGTEFQQRVWQALQAVPFGHTLSYLTLTRRLGDEKAIRAVASANGRNPIWILIPCHRIIGSNGDLTGYAGGIWRKKWLIEHEQGGRQLSLL